MLPSWADHSGSSPLTNAKPFPLLVFGRGHQWTTYPLIFIRLLPLGAEPHYSSLGRLLSFFRILASSCTLRPLLESLTGSRGSGAHFEFPKNYFVWGFRKIDSRPYKSAPCLHFFFELGEIFRKKSSGKCVVVLDSPWVVLDGQFSLGSWVNRWLVDAYRVSWLASYQVVVLQWVSTTKKSFLPPKTKI